MDLAERPARKGTKSCAECRRRKLRCDWDSQDATACRRCSERGSECNAQVFYVKPTDPHKLSSRQRIQLLESRVASLVKAVNAETDPSPSTSGAHDTPGTHASASSWEGNAEGGISSDSDSDEAVPDNKPAHLNALFENDWLSTNENREETHVSRNANKYLHAAKVELEKLIPSKNDLNHIIANGGDTAGLEFMEINFPEPWVLTTPEGLLAGYGTMRLPQINAFTLAFWLCAVSKLAEHIVAEPGTPGSMLPGRTRKLSDLPKLVGKAIEGKILRHDKLLGCSEGLGLAMECVRLHLYRGNFQKSWLLLRRAIAMAELRGFPQIARSTQLDTSTTTSQEGVRSDPVLAKAHLWESLLDLDKICGTMLNLPAGTVTYEPQRPRPLVVDGEVRDRAYLRRLAELSVQTRYIDNWTTCAGSKRTLYPSVLDLDRQLRELTLEVPTSWWSAPMSDVDPRHIIHYWQGYVAMRIHLPFTLEREPEPVYMYSHMAGIDACKTLLTRYHLLRRKLPAAFFLGRLMDVQAFTASIVLLLTSQGKSAADGLYWKSAYVNIEDLVDTTAALMEEKSQNNSGGTNFGKSGSTTIRALRKLLSAAPSDVTAQQELTLKVPLLGKVTVRRRQTGMTDGPGIHGSVVDPGATTGTPIHSDPSASNAAYPLPLLPGSQAPAIATQPQADSSLMGALTLRDWHQPSWEPFSWWVVNNYDDSFQDALMADVGLDSWDMTNL